MIKLDTIQTMNKYSRFGYETFGPFLLDFVEWLDDELNNKEYDNIFFFSRDGYMMKKAYEVVAPDTSKKSQYVYFSRKSIRQALLWQFTNLEESLIYISKTKYVSIGSILEYFGFAHNEVKDICRKMELSICDCIKFSNICTDERILRFYNQYFDEIYDKSIQQFNYLKKYINQINMKNRCAIVDIGWKGSMQFYLEEFFSIAEINTVIDGYYIGIEKKYKLKGNVSGFVYSDISLKNRKKILSFFGICEKWFQSTAGTVLGYKEQEETIIPAIAEYEYNQEPNIVKKIELIQEAAIQYVYDNNRKNKKTYYKSNAKSYSIDRILRFGTKPSLEEVDLFKEFYTLDGSKAFFIPQKNLYEYKVKELIIDLNNSSWKVGFMKMLFKVPFPFYIVYKLVSK